MGGQLSLPTARIETLVDRSLRDAVAEMARLCARADGADSAALDDASVTRAELVEALSCADRVAAVRNESGAQLFSVAVARALARHVADANAQLGAAPIPMMDGQVGFDGAEVQRIVAEALEVRGTDLSTCIERLAEADDQAQFDDTLATDATCRRVGASYDAMRNALVAHVRERSTIAPGAAYYLTWVAIGLAALAAMAAIIAAVMCTASCARSDAASAAQRTAPESGALSARYIGAMDAWDGDRWSSSARSYASRSHESDSRSHASHRASRSSSSHRKSRSHASTSRSAAALADGKTDVRNRQSSSSLSTSKVNARDAPTMASASSSPMLPTATAADSAV